MPLTKKPTQKQKEKQRNDSFSQARLDRISESMQPLMTKHVSDDELEMIFRDVDGFVTGGKGRSASRPRWSRLLGSRFRGLLLCFGGFRGRK
jgi:hypothetical protein